jgi:vancomycin resistance protein YoaR
MPGLFPFAFALALLALAAPRPARAQDAAPADTSSPRAPRPRDEEFPVALGSFTTTLLGSRPERTANIALAAEALDGAVMGPGEVLSFNAVVGPRTPERGYQSAPVILHETRQLQAGGGVCQVASTIFAAGMLAGLSNVERWRHSSPVDYIAPGEDATIAWGAKDLRLRNDLAQRVRLRVRVLGTTLSVRVDGETAEPAAYDLETVERELPADDGADGARPGREIELYRVRRGAGGESRELVHRDVFPPSRGRPAP